MTEGCIIRDIATHSLVRNGDNHRVVHRHFFLDALTDSGIDLTVHREDRHIADTQQAHPERLVVRIGIFTGNAFARSIDGIAIGANTTGAIESLGESGNACIALPVLVLTVAGAGAVARFARNSMLEVLNEDYIRTARAMGLTEWRVIWVHALRNAATPLVQLLGLSLPFLLSGSLVIEVVFSWPGLGRLTYDSILARDYPVVLAATALSGALVIAGNLLADLLQFLVDPRVRE